MLWMNVAWKASGQHFAGSGPIGLSWELLLLLRQPSIITCCDRFDRNCVSIDNTDPPKPTEHILYSMPYWLTVSKAAMKSICTILASCPLSNALCSVLDKHNSASLVSQTFPIGNLGGWKHTTEFHKSSKTNGHPTFKHLRKKKEKKKCLFKLKTFDITMSTYIS